MSNRIYPVGYSTYGSDQLISQLMNDPAMLLIDSRYKPHSWRPEWRQEALRSKYGARYRWAGAFLGNTAYNARTRIGDKPYPTEIKIADLATGIRGLQMYLSEGHDLVLLCQCADYSACHRKVIVDALKVASPETEIILQDRAGPVDTLKCLSIQQPWSWLIVNGHKDIENREWTTSYRGPVLIHAGAKIDDDWFNHRTGFPTNAHPMRDLAPADMPARQDYAIKALLGMANLIDVVEDSSSPWFVGRYGFVFIDAKPFKEPIPYSGSLRLFDVAREVVANAEVSSHV